MRNANSDAWFTLSGQSVGAGPISKAEAATKPADACEGRGTEAGRGRASDSPARAGTYGDGARREALGTPRRGWVGFFEGREESSFQRGLLSTCLLSEKINCIYIAPYDLLFHPLLHAVFTTVRVTMIILFLYPG